MRITRGNVVGSSLVVQTSSAPGVWEIGDLFNNIKTNTWPSALLGKASSNPASSIAALRAAGQTTDGAYWFSTTTNPTPFQAYVKFNYIDGNDWCLILKVFNQGDMPSGSSYWQNTTLNNSTDFNLTSGSWSKYASWTGMPFKCVMTVMTNSNGPMVPPIMAWTNPFPSMYGALSGSTIGNQTGYYCLSSNPYMGSTGYRYYSGSGNALPMLSGVNPSNNGGAEWYIQAYGLACWGNNSTESSTAEGYASVARAGAWIGGPLDESSVQSPYAQTATNGADSGFGVGVAGGNPAKTSSCGIDTWTISTSTNLLPAWVWVR